jgi:hypothetical protein
MIDLRYVALGPDSTPLFKLLDDVHHHIAQRVSVAVGGSAMLDEWAVLAMLSDRAGPSMRQIADSTHTPPPTMTKLINRKHSAPPVTCG